MGLLDKVKNLFTDEIEDEPIKSEMIQVEIPAPTKVMEKEAEPEIKVEEKVATPIFFDDEYFKELEQPKKEVKSSYMKEPVKQREEKKIFRPTPIISPVYGVLDKNYNKEDIKNKNEKTSLHNTNTKISIDDIRKKAFGTLEDELETTLFGNNSILFSEIKEEPIIVNEEDLFEELTEDIHDEQGDDIINIVEEEMEKDNPISESELFDLIDSMYEKGDKE